MKLRYLFLAAVAILTCGLANGQSSAVKVVENGDPAKADHIVISKETMTLRLYDVNGKVIYNFPIAAGKNYGNKKLRYNTPV